MRLPLLVLYFNLVSFVRYTTLLLFLIMVEGAIALDFSCDVFAFGVPLALGSNSNVDIRGECKETHRSFSTNVAAGSKVNLDVAPKSGAAPLEVNFKIEYRYPDVPARIVSGVIDWEGDGVDDYTATSIYVTYTYNQEGLFHPTVTLTDENGNQYMAKATIEVYPGPPLEQIWHEMNTKLLKGDLEGALEYFHAGSREKYKKLFSRLPSSPILTADMQDFQLIYAKGSMAKCRIRRTQMVDGNPKQITYYVYFVRDAHGNWFIRDF